MEFVPLLSVQRTAGAFRARLVNCTHCFRSVDASIAQLGPAGALISRSAPTPVAPRIATLGGMDWLEVILTTAHAVWLRASNVWPSPDTAAQLVAEPACTASAWILNCAALALL